METKHMHPKTEIAGRSADRKPTIAAPAVADGVSRVVHDGVSKVSAARSAVQSFLTSELGARECRITKIAPVDHGSEGWSAEAEILVPNLDIKSLGLPLTQEILEQEHYNVVLGLDLAVRSYEFLSPNDG
jgi:hypothetical protein